MTRPVIIGVNCCEHAVRMRTREAMYREMGVAMQRTFNGLAEKLLPFAEALVSQQAEKGEIEGLASEKSHSTEAR